MAATASEAAPQLDLSNWMKYLDPSKRVIDTYIPASHDASAYTTGNFLDWLEDKTHEVVGSITQSTNYTGQLAAGSRYFDMRIIRAGRDGKLHMKHNMLIFETFETVLQQLKDYSNTHRKEFFFLDLDFEPHPVLREAPPGPDIIKTLTNVLGENNLTDLHVQRRQPTPEDPRTYVYNKELTWKELQDGGKQFIVIWQEGDDSGKTWAPRGDWIRYNKEQDFNKKSIEEIVAYLKTELGKWNKDLLFVTQLINTPENSVVNHPAHLDEIAAPKFNEFVTTKGSDGKLGIVKRDFLNSSWNRDSVAALIKMNSFLANSQPFIKSLGDPVNYGNTIRLRADDGRYLCVAYNDGSVLNSDGTGMNLLTLKEESDLSSSFYILEERKDVVFPVSYSGNIDADTTNANGNCRLMHRHNGKWDKFDSVLSVDSTAGGQLYWGVSWGSAKSLGTFLFYDPENVKNTGSVRWNSRVLIRSMWNRTFLKIGQDDKQLPRVYATGKPGVYDGSLFTVERWTGVL